MIPVTKGAPQVVMNLARLDQDTRKRAEKAVDELAPEMPEQGIP
jgi:hypothetical protein